MQVQKRKNVLQKFMLHNSTEYSRPVAQETYITSQKWLWNEHQNQFLSMHVPYRILFQKIKIPISDNDSQHIYIWHTFGIYVVC
jgi:hypothetical protein